MDKLTKDEVILQLANLASGIERTTGDSLKAKALREAISFLDGEVSDQENEARIKHRVESQENATEKRYNIHGCGSANLVIRSLERDLGKQKAKAENFAAHIERIANVVLSDRFPDEVGQNQLLFLVKRRAPKTGLLELNRETAYNAIMWSVSGLSKPEQDIVSAKAVGYINEKWPLDDSGNGGGS